MAIITTQSKVHWNYFIALERDLEVASRYVEFAASNLSTYSIEFAHLLFAASSEVDVVAKLLCKHLDHAAPRANIDHYRQALTRQIPDLAQIQVYVPRYGLTLTPWSNWQDGNKPDWWRSYNNVKHERDAHFQEATLKNALNSLAGLLTLVFYHYGLSEFQNIHSINKKETTSALLQPESTLLRFGDEFYYDNLVC